MAAAKHDLWAKSCVRSSSINSFSCQMHFLSCPVRNCLFLLLLPVLLLNRVITLRTSEQTFNRIILLPALSLTSRSALEMTASALS